MMVSEDLSRGEWELRITDIHHSDAGNYECQINTNPLLSHTITLSVVGKKMPKKFNCFNFLYFQNLIQKS